MIQCIVMSRMTTSRNATSSSKWLIARNRSVLPTVVIKYNYLQEQYKKHIFLKETKNLINGLDNDVKKPFNIEKLSILKLSNNLSRYLSFPYIVHESHFI